MEDRFTRGFTAGAFAGLIINIFDYVASILQITDTRYVDVAAHLIYGRKSDSLIELLIAYFGQLIFSAFLGAVYAYIIIGITSRNHVLKGWLYGIVIWFLVYAIIVLFNVPDISENHFPTTAVNGLLASIYGILLTKTLIFIEKRFAR
jgi:hypothetical protein